MQNKLQDLLNKYLDDNLSQAELDEFLEFARREENQVQLQDAIRSSLIKGQFDGQARHETADRIFNTIVSVPSQARIVPISTGTLRDLPTRRSIAARLSIAASVIILATAAIWWLLKENPHSSSIAVKTTADAPPGGDRATLTLADGSVIILDTVANGTLAAQGNMQISKKNGTVTYEFAPTGSDLSNSAPLYNTISTPKGGQYEIILPDGTRAKLNAVSSLRFPAAFTGKERRVELSGQGYFEVARQTPSGSGAKQPFIVVMPQMTVEVLGTRFDIMSYTDEKNIVTTLVQGSVKIRSGQAEAILKAGQQAKVSPENSRQAGTITSDNPITIGEADTDGAIAWTNGLFQFDHADIRDIMRQVQRWYNINVVYESMPTKRFSGTISRNVNISELFRTLELTENVRFRIEGNTVYIRS